MKIKIGYLYHIKDNFFNLVDDNKLMQNYENGHTRPTYYAAKIDGTLWFVPLSSRIEKYKNILAKRKKHNYCETIIVSEIFGTEQAILLQNAFPCIEKFVAHVHNIDGVEIQAINSLKVRIDKNLRRMLRLKTHGINLFMSDIDRIKDIIINELVQKV
nr:hypothetical protein [Bacilli bacterium]